MKVLRYCHALWLSFSEPSKIKFYFYRALGARQLADYLYRRKFGRPINWNSPKDLNEWINWLAFSTDTTEWSRLADKLAVREYVADKRYADTIIPVLQIWDKPDDISVDNLTGKFVLKTNSASGDAVMVSDKSTVDIYAIRKHFKDKLSRPFGIDHAEPHYLRINPQIFAESMLDHEKQAIKSDTLIDYKFFCFNGKVLWCWVVKDRTKEHQSTDLYFCDRGQWERCNQYLNFDQKYLRSEEPIPAPQNLAYMLEISGKLSEGFPQMRVDLYEVAGKVWFGECTLTSLCGRMHFFTCEGLMMMGKMCAKACRELHLV